MQLRTITTAFAGYSLVASATPCSLINMQGYFTPSTDMWLQIHDAAALPANTAVPLKSFALLGASAFSWKFDPTPLNLATGLVVCVSSTEATLTLATGGNTADIQVDIEELRILPVNDLSSVGDLTTGVDVLQVWAEAAGPKTLMDLTAINGYGSTHYLLFYGVDAVNTGDQSLLSVAVGPGATTKFGFGVEGLSFAKTEGVTVSRKGMTIKASSTGGVWTDPGGEGFNLLAHYK